MLTLIVAAITRTFVKQPEDERHVMTTVSRLGILAVFSVLFGQAMAEEAPKRPLIVAHRGLLLDAPENTLANFSACLKLNLGFEVDVQRSRDGHLVCVHDDTVNRTTNGTGKVSELSLAELKQLDAGSWFDASYRGQRVPTIDGVFELVSNHRGGDVLIAVDFKGADTKIEADVVRLAEKHGVLHRLLMIGRAIQHPDVRKRLRKASAKSHVAAVANTADELAYAIKDELSDWVYVRFVPTREEVVRIHASGKKAFIAGATVASKQNENWRQVTERGIDGILTDYSIQLARQLRSESRPPAK
jgi:glycerophosphoryl diester phosphodiesterase